MTPSSEISPEHQLQPFALMNSAVSNSKIMAFRENQRVYMILRKHRIFFSDIEGFMKCFKLQPNEFIENNAFSTPTRCSKASEYMIKP